MIGTQDDAEYICNMLSGRIGEIESVEMASWLRTEFNFGSTITLIGMKNDSGNLLWSDNQEVLNQAFWSAPNSFLPSEKCVHASICNNSTPLRWHVADCSKLVPFLCKASKCNVQEIENLQNVSLTDYHPSSVFAGGNITYFCDKKYSIKGKSLDKTVYCTVNGTWIETLENCTLHICSNLPSVPNAWEEQVSGSDLLEDEKKFICKPGYNTSHEKNFEFRLKCNLPGWEWIGDPADCDCKYK